MAVIYLTHPVHGAKVATMDIEAEADEKNGWIRYNSDTSSELVHYLSFHYVYYKRMKFLCIRTSERIFLLSARARVCVYVCLCVCVCVF